MNEYEAKIQELHDRVSELGIGVYGYPLGERKAASVCCDDIEAILIDYSYVLDAGEELCLLAEEEAHIASGGMCSAAILVKAATCGFAKAEVERCERKSRKYIADTYVPLKVLRRLIDRAIEHEVELTWDDIAKHFGITVPMVEMSIRSYKERGKLN